MGFFDFLKKKRAQKTAATVKTPENEPNILSGEGLIGFIRSNLEDPSDENVLKALDALAKPADDLEHLTPEGELPWGWHSHNKAITEKINAEYSHFLKCWLESRDKAPKEHYTALKSFVMYLDDAERMCWARGECFEFWFYNVIASKEYIEKRRRELNDLIENFSELSSNFDRRESKLKCLDKEIVKALEENPGILQSDFVKLFDPTVQADVRDKLYHMEKSGKLQRTKSGRSYILHYKK